MKKIADYLILEKIDQTSTFLVYRAQKDDSTYIIKVLTSLTPSPSEIAQFKQEYNIIKSIDSEYVIKVYDILPYKNTFALVLEDFNGESLNTNSKHNSSACAEERSRSINDFLSIAIKLAEALESIHKKDIIHKDIKPQNILINREKNIIKITNFGIEQVLTHKNKKIYNMDIMGTLVYMSPEQTGSMNWIVDYRTDLYSLGITIYEMLAGAVPFISDNPLEIIHSHIAQKPLSLHEMYPDIPQVISDIVMKLLSKAPEERYQNSFGLLADLKECLNQLNQTQEIKSFPLAQMDIPNRFNIPQKLFGRDHEIASLITAFEQAGKGSHEVMIISGYQGIGKSALIHEIHKPIVEKRGYFISGKYERFRSDVPYNAIIHAFQQFIRQLLVQGNQKINQWKNKFLQGMGTHVRLIIDLIPEFDMIISSHQDVPMLDPEESEKRFHYVFKNFVKVLAREEHPLVLFLDDLQWADSASIKLINILLSDPDIRFFFFIGAYCDNEVSDSHPFITTIHELEQSGMSINRISLMPFSVGDLTDFIANFLRCTKEKALPLSELIYGKTYGNPFFVNQFIKALYDDGLLKINPESGWDWDIDPINNMMLIDNAVELMAEKISQLKEHTQEVLKTCACIGTKFDLETISKIFNKSMEEIFEHLSDAMKQGFIAQSDEYYIFNHDWIQEAAYSLIPEQRRSILHFTIGRCILENTVGQELYDKIFYIVNHLNLGQKLIIEQNKRNELAELNLIAGKKARNAAAFSQMFNYLKSAILLLNENSWRSNYELTLSIYVNAVEAAYIEINYKEMERYSQEILNNAKSLLDTIKVHETKIKTFIAQNNLNQAINTAREVLRMMGIKFPKNPQKWHVLFNLLKMKIFLFKKPIDKLIEIPAMDDPDIQAKIQIITSLFPISYFGSPQLLPLLIFKTLRLIIKYGNVPISPYIYATYGIILCTIGDINTGYQFGRIALNLFNHMDKRNLQTQTYFAVYNFIQHWKEHTKNALNHLIETFHIGLETGNTEFAAYSLMVYCSKLFFVGENLEKVEQEMMKYVSVLSSLKQYAQLNNLTIEYQVVLNLRNTISDPCSLVGTSYDETKMLPIHIKDNDHTTITRYYVNKIFLFYIFQRYQEAYELSIKVNSLIDTARGSIYIPILYFLNSLTMLIIYNTYSLVKQKKIIRDVSKNKKKIKKWAEHAPMNYLHKYYLVEAELARVKKNYNKAMKLYEQAIYNAHKNEYIQEEAIAYECAARFYLERKFKEFAVTYMTKAYVCYKKWGAAAKIKDMEKKYSHLIFNIFGNKNDSFVSNQFTSPWKITQNIDISTLLKASCAIASEIDMGRLLETLMRISMENGSAEKGFFIFEKENKKLYIEAEYVIDDNKVEVLQSIPIKEGVKLAARVVQYVQKTGEYILLHNAFQKGIFVDDPYIKSHKVKSIFCAPLIRKEKIMAIIYLENNQVTKAFTKDKLGLIGHLSSQAAISIENAKLIIDDKNKAIIEKEIEMAKKIQVDLLPSDIPKMDKVVVDYKHVPVVGIGGDFVSINYNKEERKLGLIICDVSGHGISAALTAAMVSMCLHFLWDVYIDEPARLLKTIRNSLKGKMGGNFFTAYICSLNLDNGMLTCACAGHPPLMIIRKKSTIMVKPKGKIIDEYFESNHRDEYVQLYSGDRIVLYTDGVSEAEMEWLEDDKKFTEWLKKESNKYPSVQEMCANIYDDLIKYTQNKILDDDFAVLAMEYWE